MKTDLCFKCSNENSILCTICGIAKDGAREHFKQKPITNYDILIRKTPEEMAVICEDGCPPSLVWNCDKVEIIKDESVKEHCQRCWIAWLQSPVEVNDA